MTEKKMNNREQPYIFSANIGKSERLLSAGTGVFITLSGIARLFSNPLLAITEIGVGAMLLDRGISGHCALKSMISNTQDEKKASSDPTPLSTAETNLQSTVIDALDLGSGSGKNNPTNRESKKYNL